MMGRSSTDTARCRALVVDLEPTRPTAVRSWSTDIALAKVAEAPLPATGLAQRFVPEDVALHILAKHVLRGVASIGTHVEVGNVQQPLVPV
ncbi:MAG: hypothetical protein QG597_606 [Actinomycetota bacterium]|nr:hypothetical protein [Actinomycetota bacterium]